MFKKALLFNFLAVLLFSRWLFYNFRSAFILRFLRKFFLLSTINLFLLGRTFSFGNRWLCLFKRGSSLLNRRFSLSDGRLQGSFVFEAFDDFFEGKSGFLEVHFELDCILLWDFNFLLKSVFAFLLEIGDIRGWIDVDSSEFVFLITFLLI